MKELELQLDGFNYSLYSKLREGKRVGTLFRDGEVVCELNTLTSPRSKVEEIHNQFIIDEVLQEITCAPLS